MKESHVGILGVIASGSGIIISHFESVHQWLQIASLSAGTLVALLSALSITITIRRKLKNKKEQDKENE